MALYLTKFSRRKFIQLTATGVAAFFFYLWDKMAGRGLADRTYHKTVLPVSRKLVSFYADYIVVNRKGKARVLSSHCTHLGCVINKVDGEKLVCPCHGSEFDLEGRAVKGPAYKPLPAYRFEKRDEQIIVEPENA